VGRLTLLNCKLAT